MLGMKTVLITGASSGLGMGCAHVFHRKGWNLVATMRNPKVDPEIGEQGNVLYAPLDVSSEESVRFAIDAAISQFGQIDVVINNAGYGITGLFEATPETDIRSLFDINVYGPMRVCRAVLPHMRRNGGGVVANVTSAAGVFAMPMGSAYTASKFALEGFSEALSYELLSQNVVVKIIEPGGIGGSNFMATCQDRSKDFPVLPEYAEFMTQMQGMFRSMAAAVPLHADLIAESVHAAVTDGTDRLRYVVTEDIEPLVRMRRETSEEVFMNSMRNRLPGRVQPRP